MRRFCCSAVLVLALALQGAVALGQRPPGLSPPTLSPYFGLFNRSNSVLPNYHEFVRPEQQARAALAQQNAVNQRQGSAIRSVQQEVTRLGEPGPRVRPTGTGSVFMNYSHFYPGSPGQGAGRR